MNNVPHKQTKWFHGSQFSKDRLPTVQEVVKAKTNAEVNVHLGEEETCNETCVYRIVSDLTYSTEYSVTIWTVGCGKSGMITTTCKTGVTGRMHVLH